MMRKSVVVDGFKPVREAGKPKPLSPPLAGRQAHPNITTDPASVAPMHSDEARECEKTRLRVDVLCWSLEVQCVLA